MTVHRPAGIQRPGRATALLGIVAVAVFWTLLAFALIVGASLLLSSMFSWQISQVLGVFGVSSG